jgi:hypothetical protein
LDTVATARAILYAATRADPVDAAVCRARVLANTTVGAVGRQIDADTLAHVSRDRAEAIPLLADLFSSAVGVSAAVPLGDTFAAAPSLAPFAVSLASRGGGRRGDALETAEPERQRQGRAPAGVGAGLEDARQGVEAIVVHEFLPA